MRSIVIPMWWNGVLVGVAMGAAHEHRWKLCLFLVATAVLFAYTAWDSWRKKTALQSI
jgi:hypothetical protein